MTECNSISLQLTKVISDVKTENMTNKGILIAFFIITLWGSNLTLLLSLDTAKIQLPLIVLAIIWQTFLYTGLFITAHDAMHCLVVAKNPQINHWIGKISVILYALFSYNNLVEKHSLHHQYPATESDPDFDHNQNQNVFIWYFKFMMSYWDWRQIVGLTLTFHLSHHVLHISYINLILFWVTPSILSSIQLFYFGTFLPHKRREGGYTNLHCTQSTPLPVFWSFITCYHFGYHKEHHEYPQIPWWRLPDVYNSN
ncbi:beta-carotene ketolase CrtW [Anabaena sp. CCY 9910]|uniref:beta-carotene ketolase CrtW n=1 Tax=Anabaena sp. CCY 9910 TaxID=3103870 RepID=UPI0039DF9D39